MKNKPANDIVDARRIAEIDRRMLELLICPVTRGALRYDAAAQELISPAARLAYPVRDGIPILLPSEARQLEIDDAKR